ncbi:MAG: 50S ribosomal protein L11 methyltransferase [Clostridiales bacterium]|nr:50S ribosomal protein L11 methyltransferase [Clostridiales bacterium]
MKWIRISLETDCENEALIADMLLELGFDGVEMIDNVPLNEADMAKMFIDIPPELDEGNKTAFVNCYVDPDVNIDEKLDIIKNGLDEMSMFMDVSGIKITVSDTEDKDWMNNWKEFFKPFRVDDKIVIKPTWEELSDKKDDDIIIEIDPGSAFGTGAHETTKLCILALKKYLKAQDSVLDVGCGSGILSIVARKLGAGVILATDIDSNAVQVARENSLINNIKTSYDENIVDDETMTFMCGNIIDDNSFRNKVGKKKYDVVVANILADIIMPLSDVIKDNLKDGGLFITSGILYTREEDVKNRLISNGFEIIDVIRMNDWVSIIAR